MLSQQAYLILPPSWRFDGFTFEEYDENDHSFLCDLLLGGLTQSTLTRDSLQDHLNREEAQCLLDFSSKLFNGKGRLTPKDSKRILSFISELFKSPQVFPTDCELKDVQCDLTKPINEGGFGYICQGTYMNHTVCIKAVRLYRQQDNIRNLRSLKHSSVLWRLPRGSGFPKNLPCNKMDGSSGSEPILEHKDPNPPRVLLLLDVINGLQHLHEYRTIHADLKASNVLVSSSGHARVIGDFGISHLRQGTSTQVSNGTPRWTASELIMDETAKPTRQSDIWSYTCLCFEVFTGELPFAQYSKTYQLCMAIVKGSITPLSSVSAVIVSRIDGQMRRSLERRWSYTPDERPTSQEIKSFFESLDILDDRPLEEDD
ncbi:hypothetical protein NP233_g3035 [Leucocoprinus birnbaumii]|uniref:Protein kinase domain-containing protein n=1 Tax=Leucocoprinus birnbaumii TaxID=56174 RepID=A0AAD5YYM7_9AGAR|nr:hypothetical protein NP233_g3035 [Leucocoprinus birnbaumii]